MEIDYKYLKENNLILYEVISGSVAYGTNLPSSDEDRRYVYILPIDYILSGDIIDQVNDDTNDVVGYELGRFLNLISSANPNLLELLSMPEDCIVYKNPVFDIILENKDKLLTKKSKNSFAGYAVAQISKAKGQDKKQNWEKDKVTRKTPLDFCYIHLGEYSIPLKDYLKDNKLDQRFCGLSSIPHGKDTYALFYDRMSDYRFSEMRPKWEKFLSNLFNSTEPLGFKGIAFEDSNELRLSSIPKDLPSKYFIGHISYNKDGYSQHCKDYNSYQTWLSERNEARWIDVQSHGQKIDGKNMMHCMRLMQMAREIAEGRGIIVRRENAEELLDIRRGKVDLQSLIDKVESEIKEIDRLFENSNLPDSVDMNFINELIIKIRKKIYKI